MQKLFYGLLILGTAFGFWACDESSTESSTDSVDDMSSSSVAPVSSSSEDTDSSSSEAVDALLSSSSIKDGSMYDSVSNTLTDLRDGQVYRTTVIGKQVWMAENLNYAYDLPTSTLDSSSFCYDNSADSCAKYGRLYLWSAAMDTAAIFSNTAVKCGRGKICASDSLYLRDSVIDFRGACPEGWHLPNAEEWYILFTTVGDRLVDSKLKSTSGWDSDSNGTDDYGFSAIPGGEYFMDIYPSFTAYYKYAGTRAVFWTSTEYSESGASIIGFNGWSCASALKMSAFSVRCVKDPSIRTLNEETDVQSSSSAISVDFTTGTMVDERDNRTYKTVTIEDQTWMAENLDYAYNEPTSTLDSSSFCYNNSADSCAKYGRLYMWSAAMDSAAVLDSTGKGCGDEATCPSAASAVVRGACPVGWHLPSKAEWNTLFVTVSGTTIGAGDMLKAGDGWNGFDSYSFAVLPAGDYSPANKAFDNAGQEAVFWSSSEHDSDYTYVTYFRSYTGNSNLNYWGKDRARSVRCIKDSDK